VAIGVAQDTRHAESYWMKVKRRINAEGAEMSPKWTQLKLPAADGKMRKTEVLTDEDLFRAFQSVPSPKMDRGLPAKPPSHLSSSGWRGWVLGEWVIAAITRYHRTFATKA
jgi:hypothetical protein